MADEPTPSTQGTEAATESEAPTDFREYAKWRATGELPEKEDVKPAAAGTGADATETPAKTEPDSEPEKTQEAGDDDVDEADDVAKGRAGSRRRKLERLTRENEELKRQVSGQSVKPPQDKPSEPAPVEGKPKLEDFRTLEEFQEALTDWKLDEREKVKAEADATRARETADRKAFDAWSKRERAAKKAHDDYEDVLDSVTIPDGPGVQAARQAMLESESGAEILYHLAKHPAELKRIAALSPVSAVREVGKLEAALAKPSAPENGTPKITGAPKPPPPTGRPSKTSSDSLDDPEVLKDFKRWSRLREAQLRSR
jgi:hypothetical protein